ncbi:MAG: TadE family protein [Opitutaceae bacterium]
MIVQRQLQQQKGAASVEAALLITFILFPLFVGIVQVANILVSYVAIINAASAGQNYFLSGNSSNVYANALAVVKASASTLNNGNLSITTNVNGTTCTDSSSPNCGTLLTTPANFGTKVTFTVLYSYTPIQGIPQLTFLPSTLSYTTAIPAPSQ